MMMIMMMMMMMMMTTMIILMEIKQNLQHLMGFLSTDSPQLLVNRNSIPCM